MQPKPVPSGGNLMALPEGHVLVGDYRIKSVLGAGGFGITYLAEEPALARRVTIKEYFPADYAVRDGDIDAAARSRDCEPDYKWGLDRFIDEAKTLDKFIHPNIVRVYRTFRANNTGYMVLCFEEGSSFKAWLKSLKRAPRQAELDTIVTPLLDALELVHKGSFLHRDIAPDNIIIRKDGTPVLIDFGSARGEMAAHSKTVSALVKPGYSPYEQYGTDARQQGPWTDIYALGGTLYHAVTGRRPADAPTRMINDEYVPAGEAALSSYRPTFLDAIDKALRLDMTKRPQSIAEWRGMLLAPAQKRGAAGTGLRGALGLAAAAANAPKPEAPSPAQGVVPAPPDTPQPKGQLLDFIEGLKKHRPASPPPRKLAAAVKQAPKPAAEAAAPPAPAKATPKREKKAEAEPASRPLPRIFRGRSAERRPPRPRRMPAFGVPSRRWRSLGYKLAIGLGIASLAVYLQDPPPQVQGRGASVVSSQTADLSQMGQLTGHKGAVQGLALADQGRSLVTGSADGTLKIWATATNGLLRTIELDDGAATALAASAGDKRVLTGHKSGTIVLWDIEKAEKLAQFQHGEVPVTGLALLNDGHRFTATNAGGAIALFDIRNPSSAPLALEAPDGVAQSAQVVAAARARAMIAFAGADRNVKLWQLDAMRGRADSGRPVRSWRVNEAGISAVDIAAHGWSTAVGGVDGSVRLLSTSNARGARGLKLHEGRVSALAFGPGDRLIASGGEDGVIRIWDTHTGQTPRTLRLNAGPVRALAFSGDGRRVFAAGQDGTVRIWSATAAPAPGN